MAFLKLLPVIFSFLLMAAHFSRVSQPWLMYLCLALPWLLLNRKKWLKRVFQFLLIAGGAVWIERTIFLINIRITHNMPWIRLAIILSAVALFTMASALMFETKQIRGRYREDKTPALPGAAAFIVTFMLLSIIQLKVKIPMLLPDRFLPGSGWLLIFMLAFYAGWLVNKFLSAAPGEHGKIRNRIWLFFSMIFFLQLFIGLAGIERFLMTGHLHLPVPAVIAAGPIFRGAGFFMPLLFLSTVILTGPAWCSYLCYIGSWDNGLAKAKKIPGKIDSRKRHRTRLMLFFLIIVTALTLKQLGASGALAAGLGLFFGLTGVGVMVFISRKKGVMAHCTGYCPIGLAAGWLGRLSPFRLRITGACTDCMACSQVCRYSALEEKDIKDRKPGLTCSLCGDCLPLCREKAIEYRFLGLKSSTARTLFYIIVISLHAVFLGVARI